MSVPSALTPAAARLVTSHSYETTGWLRVLSASLGERQELFGGLRSRGNSASASLWMRVPLGPGMPHMAKCRGVFDVGLAAVDVGEADLAAVPAGLFPIVVGRGDAFAPSVEECGDLGGVDGAADRGEVLCRR